MCTLWWFAVIVCVRMCPLKELVWTLGRKVAHLPSVTAPVLGISPITTPDGFDLPVFASKC